MYESSIVQYFTERAIQQGQRQQRIEDLFEALEIRFGSEGLEELKPKVAAIEDLETLKQLFQAALRVSDLAQFAERLERPVSPTNGNAASGSTV